MVVCLYQIEEIQNHNELFFDLFCTWFDREHKSDHRKIVLEFSKHIYSKKYFKRAQYAIFWGTEVSFGNGAIVFSSCLLLQTNFSLFFV